MGKRLRFKFSKTGAYKYLSHLDIISIIIRAIRRAGIEIEYSGGFNPKPKIIFGPPIPLGIESIAEYADVYLKDNINAEDFLLKMNQELEKRIIISDILEVRKEIGNLMSQVDIAEYHMQIYGNDASLDIILRLAEKVLLKSGLEDTVYDISPAEAGSDRKSICFMLYGYTKTAKGRNEKVFKLRDFMKEFKSELKANHMYIKRVFKNELFIFKHDKKLTPFEVL